MQKIFLKGAVTILAVLLLASLVLGQVSVPNQITFQGRLTDASGNPVADGAHTVNFTLWTLPVGGSNVWTENTSQTTSGGLFTHNLGSLTAFSATLFENNDSLYLQIQADGQTITPRIRLTSTPYTRLANNIETYGSDGEPNIQTGGTGWGEIWLLDSDPSNFLGVNLGAYDNGGALDLHNNAGAAVISLDAGNTGDASALLPTDAINAGEMLNEPGIAHEYNSGSITLTTTTTAYDTVSLTVPTSGYIVVAAHVSFTINHTTGVDDLVRTSISKTAGVIDFDNAALWRVNENSPTNTGFDEFMALSCTKVEAVAAGTHTYYLNSDRFGATGTILRRHFTAMFFPTAYGTVVSSLASATANNDGFANNGIGPKETDQSKFITITAEEHNARLEAEVAKLKAELNTRLQKLEQQLNQTRKPGIEE